MNDPITPAKLPPNEHARLQKITAPPAAADYKLMPVTPDPELCARYKERWQQGNDRRARTNTGREILLMSNPVEIGGKRHDCW